MIFLSEKKSSKETPRTSSTYSGFFSSSFGGSIA